MTKFIENCPMCGEIITLTPGASWHTCKGVAYIPSHMRRYWKVKVGTIKDPRKDGKKEIELVKAVKEIGPTCCDCGKRQADKTGTCGICRE